MSGTSVDSIDAVALHCGKNHAPQLVAHCSHAWPPALQAQLKTLPLNPPPQWRAYLELDLAVAQEHARAVEKLRTKLPQRQDIAAVGFHGQTIFHLPPEQAPGNSLQLGSPATLAQLCARPVVADFRRADMAQGGQGAPLAPMFHREIWGSLPGRSAVLNLGGIANLSFIDEHELKAGFDTGPANGLMDGFCQRHLGLEHDPEGSLAAQGQVIAGMLSAMLDDPYFAQQGPKSTGREYFSQAWLERHLNGQEQPNDVLRTLLELSVATIAQGLEPLSPDQIIVVGGGAHNRLLMRRLAETNPAAKFRPCGELGWPEQSIEAGLFAWLAMRHLTQQVGNAPAVTGAKEAVVLGALYPAP